MSKLSSIPYYIIFTRRVLELSRKVDPKFTTTASFRILCQQWNPTFLPLTALSVGSKSLLSSMSSYLCHFFISGQKTSRSRTLIDPSRIEFFREKSFPRRSFTLLEDRSLDIPRSIQREMNLSDNDDAMY